MKFKEPRLLTICLIAFIGMVILAVKAAGAHETAKLIITLVLSLMALTMVMGRFNILVQDDFMLIYVFKYIGILPVMVDYKDVQEVKLLSKVKVQIKTDKHVYQTYIIHAEKFVRCLKEKTEQLELSIKYL